MQRQKITIWDEDAKRLMASEKNLRVVMNELHVDADVQLNSEPPLLARHRINGKTPAVQINDGDFWTHTLGEAVGIDHFSSLLRALKQKAVLK